MARANDAMLSAFDALDYGAKKQTLDAFLVQEQQKAVMGEVTSGPSGMASIAAVGGAESVEDVVSVLRKAVSTKGGGRRQTTAQREYQGNCPHEFDKWGGCLVCGEQRREADEPETEGLDQ